MPWSKLKDKEPYDKNQEYFLRNGGDKYIGWWNNDEKEFYQSAERGGYSYFDKEDYPNIEWWDESEEANQDILWEELFKKLNNELGCAIWGTEWAIKSIKDAYALIRK